MDTNCRRQDAVESANGRGLSFGVSGSLRRAWTMLARALVLTLAMGVTASAFGADQFMKPTKEELSMTSLPGFPGAAAVVLYREQITRDDLHDVQHYDRIKILTEEGKKYANVELGYVGSTYQDSWTEGDDKKLDSIVGRTIQPDGTIIPFTGKPYRKEIAKTKELKYQEMVFTLPDVEVGSIIEYRYHTDYSDNAFEAPDWYLQGDLYVKAEHFAWYPTTHELIDGRNGKAINAISWFPILPPGAKIERTQLPVPDSYSGSLPQQIYSLTVKDVPPVIQAEYMPPIASFSYRVLFNFSSYRTADEFWKSQGKDWSKRVDSFAKQNSDLRSATDAITAGATTQDQKLRKIYAAVMTIENTDYTRRKEQREDKANGLGKMNDAGAVLQAKQGSGVQITDTFIAMARAAGMKAYAMLVPDRAQDLFVSQWLNMQQFDNTIAIVNVDGKDVFFDPGERYCAYGNLAWQHTMVQGLRQNEDGTGFAMTPGEAYSANKTTRVANLDMDEKGQITGKIDLTFFGAPALHWRSVSLAGDNESLKLALRNDLERMIPKSLEVKDLTISDLDDYQKPLAVRYMVQGSMGTAMGKRLVMPADLFLADSTATFPNAKREVAVYFHYPQMVEDALRVNFHKGFSVEAVPSAEKYSLPKKAIYDMDVTSTPASFTTRREFVFADILVLPADYTQLRSFYTQFEANDQQSVVLKSAPVVASVGTPAAGN